MTTMPEGDRFTATVSQRRAIAPHRGDVTTVRAAERLRARAAEGRLTMGEPRFGVDEAPREHGVVL